MFHKEFEVYGECWVDNMPSVADGKIVMSKPFECYETHFEGSLTTDDFKGFINEIFTRCESRVVVKFTFNFKGGKYSVDCLVTKISTLGLGEPIDVKLFFLRRNYSTVGDLKCTS